MARDDGTAHGDASGERVLGRTRRCARRRVRHPADGGAARRHPDRVRGPAGTAHPAPSPTRAAPAPRPPGGTYAQVVNPASGLCLSIDGDPENRTDVVTARCSSPPAQRWRFDAARGVLQSSADPDHCLDGRGAVDRGVGIWACDSVDGRNGQNLRFAVGTRGVIRPAVAPDHAAAPAGGDSLALAGRRGGRTGGGGRERSGRPAQTTRTPRRQTPATRGTPGR